jgi:hypothetical protein
MQKISEKIQKNLIKKFHTLLSRAGINNDEKLTILAAYGASSSKMLNVSELMEICDKIQSLMNPEIGEMDKWRKRVIASIAGYLEMSGIEHNMYKVKAIACRASGHKFFNSIPKQDLISVYNAFKNKQKISKNVEKMSINSELPAAVITAPRVYA